MNRRQRQERARMGGLAAAANMSPEARRERARKGGLVGGRAVTATLTPEERRRRGKKSARTMGREARQERTLKAVHAHWHKGRHLSSPDCLLCWISW